MKEWPEENYQIADQFIREQIYLHGTRMDVEECRQEGWRAFLEARETYHRVEGCCTFRRYAEHLLQDAFRRMRKARNERIVLESVLSLDQPFGEATETVGMRCFPGATNDCSNIVALRDYICRQGPAKARIIWQLYHQMDPQEVMAQEHLTRETYHALLHEIRIAFSVWQKL